MVVDLCHLDVGGILGKSGIENLNLLRTVMIFSQHWVIPSHSRLLRHCPQYHICEVEDLCH